MEQKRKKQIGKEAQILRYMRMSKGISLNQAGRLLKISGSAIAHIEQGRMELSRRRLETMLIAYQYSTAEYLEFLEGKEIPISLKDHCHRLINQLSDDRIKTLFPLLETLTRKTI